MSEFKKWVKNAYVNVKEPIDVDLLEFISKHSKNHNASQIMKSIFAVNSAKMVNSFINNMIKENSN